MFYILRYNPRLKFTPNLHQVTLPGLWVCMRLIHLLAMYGQSYRKDYPTLSSDTLPAALPQSNTLFSSNRYTPEFI